MERNGHYKALQAGLQYARAMIDRMPPETRKAVTSAGGHGRAAALTGEERAAVARSGGRASHTPASLARRIVKAWPGLSRAERNEVRAILAPLMPRRDS